MSKLQPLRELFTSSGLGPGGGPTPRCRALHLYERLGLSRVSGSHNTIDRIDVTWPSGLTTSVEGPLGINTQVTITEPAFIAASGQLESSLKARSSI